jgi:hypothetical protein
MRSAGWKKPEVFERHDGANGVLEMRIMKLKAVGLRGKTPEGGWAYEIQPYDCIQTLICIQTLGRINRMGQRVQ